MQTIGTCSNCGGPVQVPEGWGGLMPPPARCAKCGSRPINEYGPIIPMESPPVTPEKMTDADKKFFGDFHGIDET